MPSPDDKKKKLGVMIAIGPSKSAPPKPPFDDDDTDMDPGDTQGGSRGPQSADPDNDGDADLHAKLDHIMTELDVISQALGLSYPSPSDQKALQSQRYGSPDAQTPDDSTSPQGDGASQPYGR